MEFKRELHAFLFVAALYCALVVGALSMSGCAAVPLGRQIDLTYESVAARQERANRHFEAGILTKTDHAQTLSESKKARGYLQDADKLAASCKSAQAGSGGNLADCLNAENRLQLAERVLQELDLYLARKAQEAKK